MFSEFTPPTMKFNLVFENSGDTIGLIAAHPELTEHVIDLFSELPPFFSLRPDIAQIIGQTCIDLQKTITQTNEMLEGWYNQGDYNIVI